MMLGKNLNASSVEYYIIKETAKHLPGFYVKCRRKPDKNL